MKKHKIDLFTLFCYIITLFVLCFIGGIVCIIIFRGGYVFAEHLKDRETLFATWMSVKTALISSILCFFVAIPTGYVLTHLPVPFRGSVEASFSSVYTVANSPFDVFPKSFFCNGFIFLCSSISRPSIVFF